MEGHFFVKTKIISWAVLEGTQAKKIHHIWAESAVHVDSYLQNWVMLLVHALNPTAIWDEV